MDKRILEQYIDACAQVKETEAELEKIRRAKKRQEQDAVKGSSHDFPYTMQTYRIEGLAYASMQEPGAEDRLEEVIKRAPAECGADKTGCGSVDQYDSGADAAYYPVPDFRGNDMGAGSYTHGARGDWR